MDISSYITKPELGYVPEDVKLLEPEPDPVLLIKKEPEPGISEKRDTIKSELIKEIAYLEDIEQAILAKVSDTAVPTPADLTEELGKEYITRSDYLISLASDDFRARSVQQAFEQGHYLYSEADPSNLLLPYISEFKSELTRNLDKLGSEIFSDEFLIESGVSSYMSGNPEGYELLELMVRDLDDSRVFRAECIRSANAFISGMRTNWALLLLEKEGVHTALLRKEADDLVELLKKIRAAITYGYTLYAADWDSIRAYSLNHIQSMLIDEAIDQVYTLYSKARARIIRPIIDPLCKISAKYHYLPAENRLLLDAIARVITDSIERSSDTLTDIMIRKQQRSGLRLSSVKNIKAMSFIRGVIKKLDILIDVIPQAIDEVISPDWLTTPVKEDYESSWPSALSTETKESVWVTEDPGDIPQEPFNSTADLFTILDEAGKREGQSGYLKLFDSLVWEE